MPGRLAKEIYQTKPFTSLEEEAVLNVARTAEVISLRSAEFLRAYQLSPTQYNLLRILRGAGADGITCSQAAERMVNHDPDITRLMDRLEARGLIARERGRQDRRVVISRITGGGLSLLESIDVPLAGYFTEQYGHLGAQKLETLIALLEEFRQCPAGR
ncbi:MAG: MarR family transcriptional regulator [Acidobacteria bacterium]|nr:MarR family transcriptional regulator [Acidobacteriota bacterium]